MSSPRGLASTINRPQRQSRPPSPQKLLRMLLDEIDSDKEIDFSHEQRDSLERRLTEINFAIEARRRSQPNSKGN